MLDLSKLEALDGSGKPEPSTLSPLRNWEWRIWLMSWRPVSPGHVQLINVYIPRIGVKLLSVQRVSSTTEST